MFSKARFCPFPPARVGVTLLTARELLCIYAGGAESWIWSPFLYLFEGYNLDFLSPEILSWQICWSISLLTSYIRIQPLPCLPSELSYREKRGGSSNATAGTAGCPPQCRHRPTPLPTLTAHTEHQGPILPSTEWLLWNWFSHGYFKPCRLHTRQTPITAAGRQGSRPHCLRRFHCALCWERLCQTQAGSLGKPSPVTGCFTLQGHPWHPLSSPLQQLHRTMPHTRPQSERIMLRSQVALSTLDRFPAKLSVA